MPDKITPPDRFRLLAELERRADNLHEIALLLEEQDAGGAAPILERAAELVAACCWVLEGPVRKYVPGWVPAANGGNAEQPADGQPV